MFNPGTPTDKRMQEQYSYGLLHGGKVAGGDCVLFFQRIHSLFFY